MAVITLPFFSLIATSIAIAISLSILYIIVRQMRESKYEVSDHLQTHK